MKKIISFLLSVVIICSGIVYVNAQDTRSTAISLTEGELASYDFSVSNLLPGDDVAQKISLNIEHNNDSEIKLKFIADDNSFQPLLEAFTVSIYIKELDKTIYSGDLKDLSTEDLFVKYTNKKEIINYQFNLHFKEETGNECANKILSGAFVWSCESVGEIPSTGDIIGPPNTGDTFNMQAYLSIACIAVLVIIILIVIKSKKRGNNG